jgi:hypothetical protein
MRRVRAGRGALGRRLLLATILMGGITGCARQVAVPQWDAKAFRELDTLEFQTVGPTEGPHWSTVWLVVLNDEVYVRLGSRASARMQENTTTPFVNVRIGGREYQRVRAEEDAGKTAQVADAMAAKYWTDVFVRYVPHPLTMRLAPDRETTPE